MNKRIIATKPIRFYIPGNETTFANVYETDFSVSPKELILLLPSKLRRSPFEMKIINQVIQEMIDIAKELSEKGNSNGIKVLVAGSDKTCASFDEESSIRYTQLNRSFLTRDYDIFARDVFHVARDGKYVITRPTRQEHLHDDLTGSFDGLPMHGLNMYDPPGGNIHLTRDKNNESTMVIGRLDYRSVMDDFLKDKFGVNKIVSIVQDLKRVWQLEDGADYKGPLKNMHHYAHLDYYTICFPGGKIVINDMNACMEIMNRHGHLNSMPEHHRNEIAKAYSVLDRETKKELEKNGFDVYMAPLLLINNDPELGGKAQLSGSLANSIPGWTPDGKPVLYVQGYDEKGILKEMGDILKNTVPGFGLELIEIQSATSFLQTSEGGLHCLFTTRSIHDGLPPRNHMTTLSQNLDV